MQPSQSYTGLLFLFLSIGSINNSKFIEIRKWKLVLCLSWGVCFFYVILISIQPYVFQHPICTIVPHEYGSYYSFACAAAVSGFFFTFMMLTVRIFHANPGCERIPSIIAWNIILVGLLSTLSFVAFNWNGLCIDALG